VPARSTRETVPRPTSRLLSHKEAVVLVGRAKSCNASAKSCIGQREKLQSIDLGEFFDAFGTLSTEGRLHENLML
jgi:hypothetical protein